MWIIVQPQSALGTELISTQNSWVPQTCLALSTDNKNSIFSPILYTPIIYIWTCFILFDISQCYFSILKCYNEAMWATALLAPCFSDVPTKRREMAPDMYWTFLCIFRLKVNKPTPWICLLRISGQTLRVESQSLENTE